jgi:hypothetical protein
MSKLPKERTSSWSRGWVERVAAEAFELDPGCLTIPPLDGFDLPSAMRAIPSRALGLSVAFSRLKIGKWPQMKAGKICVAKSHVLPFSRVRENTRATNLMPLRNLDVCNVY